MFNEVDDEEANKTVQIDIENKQNKQNKQNARDKQDIEDQMFEGGEAIM